MRRAIAYGALTGAVAILVAAASAAATVTINAPAGSVTNAFAFVSGEDSLAVNTGATGGTVHLSPYSTHTGGTTLGAGTLVLAKPVGADETTGELGAGARAERRQREGGGVRSRRQHDLRGRGLQRHVFDLQVTRARGCARNGLKSIVFRKEVA